MDELWQLNLRLLASRSQFKQMSKKHRAEFAACWDNLKRVVDELNAGKRIGGFSFGFFRSEHHGVYRIGQTRVKSPCELRLYIYPDALSKTIYILSLGDKGTQSDDINACHEIAKSIRGDDHEHE